MFGIGPLETLLIVLTLLAIGFLLRALVRR